MKSYRLAIACYLAVVFILFFPIFLPPEGTLVFGSDIHRSYHFFRQFFHDAVAGGIFPWWNPYLFSGEPLIANPSLSFWYPPNWLFVIFPYRYVYSWLIVSHIFFAMIGMYWLAKKWMGTIPAWCAGIVFGLSGFFMGRIWEGHIEIITSAPYLPIVFGLFWMIGETQNPKQLPKRIVLAALALALQIYAGYQTIALFTLEAVCIATLLHCYIAKKIKPFLWVGVAIVLGLGLAALQIVPSQEFFSRSIRTYPLPYSWAVFGSYTAENLKQLIDPFILGFPWAYRGPSPNFGEMAAYIGKIPLVLSFIGLVCVLKRRLVAGMSMAVIALFGLWVSLGWNAPVDLNRLLWETVPPYTYLRIPARHLILLVFSLSLLAGFGLSRIKKRLFQIVLVGLTVVDLVWFGKHFVVLAPDPSTRHNETLVSTLKQDKELVRMLPNFNVGMETREALDFDAPMVYGLYSASGYDPSILRNYYQFIAAANGITYPDVQRNDVQIPILNSLGRAADFLNIKYFFVPTWLDTVGGPSDRYRLVLEDSKRDFWRLYENKNVLPRFYIVPRLTVLPDRDAVAAAIRAGNIDFQTTVIVVRDQLGESKKSTTACTHVLLPTVEVNLYSPNEVRLTTSAPCDTYLVSSEVWYPGWEGTIDGQKAELMEGNLAFRTMYIPAGSHTVTMEYQPNIFVIGGFVSLATVVGCLLWMKRKEGES